MRTSSATSPLWPPLHRDVEAEDRGSPARRIARPARDRLSRDHLIAALEAQGANFDSDMRCRVAVHEAGHALAALRLGVSTDITISITSNNGSSGRMILQEPDGPLTRPMVESRLVVPWPAGRPRMWP